MIISTSAEKKIDWLLREGYAKKVPAHCDGESKRPHHSCNTAGKSRVVHDCAATGALNESLLQGPDLTNTLLGISLRFRKGRE